MKLLVALLLVSAVSTNKHQCPGTTFSCDDSATCCQLLDKSYGCCPLVNAVCCDDHIHCCPANTKCSTGMCIQQNSMGVTSFLAHPIKANNVTCPGAQYTCPEDTTCCEGSAPGTYGCCPMEDAVCCEDKEHCCPSGTTCNLEKEKCDGDGFTSLMYSSKKKLHESELDQIVEMEPNVVSSVVCPGSSFQCPDLYTCCKLPGDEWGCCPFDKATCCADKLHCCPEGMKCDATSTHCTQGFYNMTSVRNVPAASVKSELIICPDHSQCQDSMTCCQLKNNKYGCCQYPNATCCSDRLHCCPSGFRCDEIAKRCVKNEPESNMI